MGVNSRNNLFLILHVVSNIKNELREIFHSEKIEAEIKHALNQNKIIIRSKNIINLVATFDTVKLQRTDREDTNLYNILTACLFKHIYLLSEHITFCLFMLKEYNSTKNLLMKSFRKNQ